MKQEPTRSSHAHGPMQKSASCHEPEKSTQTKHTTRALVDVDYIGFMAISSTRVSQVVRGALHYLLQITMILMTPDKS